MLESLKYKNHMGEVIDFGQSGIYVSSNDLHDYSWTVTQKNDRISAFKRSVATRTLPVVIFCQTAEDGVAARNRLLEVAEKDVLAKKPGRIIVGDYYFSCYVTGSKKSNYLATRRRMEAKLTLVSDAPYWARESEFSFDTGTDSGSAAVGENYALLDYPFDFAGTNQLSTFVNPNFVGSNFRLIVYGEAVNPTVYIGGHKYQVSCTVGANEYLTIDSVAKTIIVTQVDGTVVNHFKDRSRDSYIFEKIPSGKVDVSWDGTLRMTLVLLEERSEPKWT